MNYVKYNAKSQAKIKKLKPMMLRLLNRNNSPTRIGVSLNLRDAVDTFI